MSRSGESALVAAGCCAAPPSLAPTLLAELDAAPKPLVRLRRGEGEPPPTRGDVAAPPLLMRVAPPAPPPSPPVPPPPPLLPRSSRVSRCHARKHLPRIDCRHTQFHARSRRSILAASLHCRNALVSSKLIHRWMMNDFLFETVNVCGEFSSSSADPPSGASRKTCATYSPLWLVATSTRYVPSRRSITRDVALPGPDSLTVMCVPPSRAALRKESYVRTCRQYVGCIGSLLGFSCGDELPKLPPGGGELRSSPSTMSDGLASLGRGATSSLLCEPAGGPATTSKWHGVPGSCSPPRLTTSW